MHRGYIKLYRRIGEHPYWLEAPFTRGQAWIDMLIMAAYKPSHVRIRGIKIDLKPGQLALSEVHYAKRWQWSRGKVRRFLAELETEQQIEQQKSNITTVVTIVNWQEYQGSTTSNETSDSTSSEQQGKQQANTDKNRYKSKNGQEEKNCADCVPDEMVQTVVSEYNQLAQEFDLPQVKRLNEKRKRSLNARYKEGMLEELSTVFDEIRHSSFLQGISGRESWKGATFDWLFGSPHNWVKVAEGKYRDRQADSSGTSFADLMQKKM